MIYKSYIVEDNINILKNNFTLFYGENLGLIDDLKKKIIDQSPNIEIIRFDQEEIIKNENLIFDQINNQSLFEVNKIIFINDVSDKLIKLIEEIHSNINANKIFLFGGVLDKKSKLRSYFEKSNNCDLIPCYKDNDVSIKKIILNKLKGYNNLSPLIINLLIANSGNDRSKLNNELNKIQLYFPNKIIKSEKIEELLNEKTEEDFDLIKDAALKGDRNSTNNLLSNIIFEIEKIPLYLMKINTRLNTIKEVLNTSKNQNLELSISKIKPPIFWKDKPSFIEQAKIWNTNKIILALNKTYKLELHTKSNNNLNKNILLKKLLLDICLLANT